MTKISRPFFFFFLAEIVISCRIQAASQSCSSELTGRVQRGFAFQCSRPGLPAWQWAGCLLLGESKRSLSHFRGGIGSLVICGMFGMRDEAVWCWIELQPPELLPTQRPLNPAFLFREWISTFGEVPCISACSAFVFWASIDCTVGCMRFLCSLYLYWCKAAPETAFEQLFNRWCPSCVRFGVSFLITTGLAVQLLASY